MSSKIITLDDNFSTGEPTVQLVSTWGRNGKLLREKTSIHKIASTKSPALEFADSVVPSPGRTIVLIIGLGDHETYGPNRNGDGFPSEPMPGKIDSDQVLTKHYQSYDNAHVFEHHANSDPEKAIGKVIKSFWNPHMRRVEVIEDFDNSKAPHLLEKILAGNLMSKSMGCVNFDTLIHTSEGPKKVQEINVGDAVLTHTGNFKKVTELHRRQYLGKLYNVRTTAGTTHATSEHPYAVMPKNLVEEFRNGGWYKKKDLSRLTPDMAQWMPAEGLEAGMYLVTPFNTEVKETLTVDQCRLLGYYAAEGHLINGTSQGISLCHHRDDALTKEIITLADKLANSWTQRPRKNLEYVLDTTVISPEIYELCKTHVGSYAREKRLSLELMQQPYEQQMAFLGAYINGDGGFEKNTNDFYISTCNRHLALQLQHVGFRCGLYSKINTLRHGPSTCVDKPTTEYRVDFSRKGATKVAEYSTKIQPYTMKSSSTSVTFIDGAILTKIKDISVLDFDGPVYNFEVEDDHSFVAENHASHNCRIKYDVCAICGNRAPTRKDYCDHLKYEMNRIYPDGKQACALNPSPVFFDSSWVIRPADRTGYMMKKIAKENIPEVTLSSYKLGEMAESLLDKAAEIGKAADIEKILQGKPVASVSTLDKSDAHLLKKYKDEALCAGQDEEDSDDIVRILISYKPSEVMGTAGQEGVPLGLKELFQYFINNLSGEELSDDSITKAANAHVEPILNIFKSYPRFYDQILKEASLDNPQYSEKLASSLYNPSTITEDYLQRKIVPPGFRPDERAKTDLVSYTDPNTGQKYQTDYGTVQKTHDSLAREGLTDKALGTAAYGGASALLGTASLGMGLSKRVGKIPTALAGLGSLASGAMAGKKLMEPTEITGPKVQTNQGETISGWTEMTPKTSSHMAPELEYLIKRAKDGQYTPLSKTYKNELYSLIKNAEVRDELSTHLGPTLDLDKTAKIIGSSILNLAQAR